jgi:hypothetical protein
VFQRKRPADFGGRSTELATPTATPRDFDHTEGGTMTDDGNLFDRRLHVLGHLDNSLPRRIARHHSLEEVAEHTLNLAID